MLTEGIAKRENHGVLRTRVSMRVQLVLGSCHV